MLDEPTFQSRRRNPSCGDEISLQVFLSQGIIEDCKFEGRGCFISQAGASLLCSRIHGRSILQLRAQQPEELLGFDLAELTLRRRECALMGFHAMQDILNQSAELISLDS